MIKLALNQERLINGTKMQKPGMLLLPAEGGGFLIPELASCGERYLNFTLCVEEDHSMAFELRVYNRMMEKKVTVRFGVVPRFRTNISLDLISAGTSLLSNDLICPQLRPNLGRS